MPSSADSDANMAGANAADVDFSDRRGAPRKRILKAGVIRALPDFEATCVVRDLSEGGAKLKVKDTRQVPEHFQLTIELDGLLAKCEVMWRSDSNEIGVRFEAPAVAIPPARKQVIYPPMARPDMPEYKPRPFERQTKVVFDK
ncbi:MAG: PilZ domain-containing protein [Alphaproteobacteria bacterium]|nr:PilZ domain-containing protein [Alphaproteobacteria bacterium]